MGTATVDAAEQLQKRHPFRSNQRFEPAPLPTGLPPFRIGLEAFLGDVELRRIARQRRLHFHVTGDTGGVKFPVAQQIVAMHMAADFTAAPAAARPSFLYHLGDVVYFYGERSEYYPQFYEAYAEYPGPIVAIPGNHDADRAAATSPPSLDAYVANFCAPVARLLPEAQEATRPAMTLPNVYWTLATPQVTVIGLYTNVPEGGRVDAEQETWFEQELAAAPKDRPVIVTLHHPPYSADAFHGGSARMGELLDAAMDSTGRLIDLVLTGHIHNYQRFTRMRKGHRLRYIVAGAGGYWHLHYVAHGADGKELKTPCAIPGGEGDITLESYADDRHGFLRLAVSKSGISGEYVTVPRPQESWTHGPVTVVDRFDFRHSGGGTRRRT